MRQLIWITALCFFAACSQEQKDKDIEKMIASQAKQTLSFAGVTFTVSNGTVTLQGACPTEEQRTEVEKKVRQTAGVKGVVNEITIAPVTLTGNKPGQPASIP